MPGRMAEIIDLTVDSKRLKTHGVESLLEKTSSSLLYSTYNLNNFINVPKTL